MTQNTLELVVTALQQRIGEIVSNYETQVAILRAEITKLSDDKANVEKETTATSNS
jgi:uncharacterized small protein (DUF1192 family)